MSAFATCRSPAGAGSPLEGVAGPEELRRARGEERESPGKRIAGGFFIPTIGATSPQRAER
jgi:hypothetical protein